MDIWFIMPKFKFGKPKRTFKYYLSGAVLVEVLSLIPFLDKKKVFNVIDEFQLKLNIDLMNDYILKDEELLNYRIERVVNKALKEHDGN